MNNTPLLSFRDSSSPRALKKRSLPKPKPKGDGDSETSTVPRTPSVSAQGSVVPSNVIAQRSKRRPTRYLEGFIPVTEDVNLESLIKIPEPQNTLPANKIAILSHPWSWFGGSMDDPVLDGVSRVFLRLDYHVILYNSRGVRHSSGHSSLTGIPETQDLVKIIEWALQEVGSVDTVVLLGYSYGSLLTSMAPSPHKLFPGVRRSCHILLSHAVGPSAFLTFFNTAKYTNALAELVAEPTSNVLAIWGDVDQFTSKKSYEAWSNKLKYAAEHSGVRAPTGEGKSVNRICQLLSFFTRRHDTLQPEKGESSPIKPPPDDASHSVLPAAGESPKPEKEAPLPTHPTSNTATDTVPGPEQTCLSTGDHSSEVAQTQTGKGSGTIPPGMVRCGAFQSTMIAGGDHFWRGERGRQMRLILTEWINKLDSGEFDTVAGPAEATSMESATVVNKAF